MAPLAQPEIQKDSDSDFCELNPLDDIEIEDQLILKKEVFQLTFSPQPLL